MATSWIIEPVTEGLVTSRDPISLQPGELQDITNGVYLPNTDALVRAPGRTAWCTVVTGSGTRGVYGLADCPFAGGTHYVVAAATGGYYKIDAEAGSPSASLITAITAGNPFASVQNNGKYYLLDGLNANVVFKSDGSSRAHGLQPTTGRLGLAITTGTWLAATGYYDYWYTEVYRTTAVAEGAVDALHPVFIESGCDGGPQTIQITSTSNAVLISIPAAEPVNALTTHFRIYRSAVKDAASDIVFPIGTLIAEVPVGVATSSYIIDGQSTDTGFRAPTATFGTPDWASPTAMFANDAVYATVNHTVNNAKKYCIIGNFGFTVADPVVGIQVELVDLHRTPGYSDASAADTITFYVEASPDAGVSWIRLGTAALPQGSGVDVTMSVGNVDSIPGQHLWTAANFSDANFRLRLVTACQREPGGGGMNQTIYLDYIQCRVLYNGANVEGTDPFPIIVTNDIATPKNGPPPLASCGASFEGSLVLNDVTKPNRLVYSYPGEPETFPSVYILQLDNPRNEQISYLGVVNNKLITGTKGGLWRVNYLPRETDTTPLDRGRAIDQISSSVGIVKPTAACLVSAPDGRQELIFASSSGIYATDGFILRSVSDDLNWYAGTYSVGGFSDAASAVVALCNDPDFRTVFLPTTLGAIYAASYAERHRKQPAGVKWGRYQGHNGTAGADGTLFSACVVHMNDGSHRMLFGYASSAGADKGKIYIQDTVAYAGGYTIPNSTDKLAFRIRKVFPKGIHGEVNLQDLSLYKADTANLGFDVTLRAYYSNAADSTESQTLAARTTGLLQTPVGATNACGFDAIYTATTNGIAKAVLVGFNVEDYADGGLRN